MEKELELIELFDIYKGLLTDKQKETFSLYYLYDLSLAEIAEQEGTARQSVHGAVKQVKAKLIEYESVLKLKEKFDGVLEVASSVTNGVVADKLKEIIGR